jgi:ribokinase
MTSPLIVCIGDVMIDVLARLSEPLHHGSDTPADVRWTGGGSAANTACWLVAAGARASFIGQVGDDVPGRAAVAALTGCGVDARVNVDEAAPTGTCLVLVDVSGERTMVPSPGANATLTATGVDLAGARHLHVSAYALFGAARDAALDVMARARAVGLSISVGAASSAPLRSAGADALFGWAGQATMFANTDEADVLVGLGDIATAARSVAQRCGEAVVTSHDAAAWSDGAEVITVAAAPVDVIDSTGAGDAFAAGFLAARISGADPAQSLARGHEFAGRACRVIGARPGPADR